MSKENKVSIQYLEDEAESNRVNGNRDAYLKIKERIRDIEVQAVQDRHEVYFKEVEKEFPVGKEIPELHTSVKELKHGCGTQRGWIEIYLYNHERSFKPHELRKKIQDARNYKSACEQFGKLKFSDRKKSFYLGEKNFDTLDMLINVMDLDLPDIEDFEEYNWEYLAELREDARKQAIEDGFTDQEAEQKADEAETDEMRDNSEKYLSAILRTLNYLLNTHHLEIEALHKGYYLTITGLSWKQTAQQVAETISGHGMFEYENAKALKDVGPYKTYCEAALTHLHWFKHYSEVYGNVGYREIYSREWR